MHGITRDDIADLAQKSHIELRGGELDRFTRQLNEIIPMVARVASVTARPARHGAGES
ncbi:hypothetical protein AB0L74_21870 [Streptomyces sp. NPDC052020]|uniref:Asp-tRNA(Asn)/Glu-tRNA(Gln) amidotransferase subunit GatC n=1 Tax=Streptomyces sp. NPDC052020 TaxID=3155677 RepID=UPI00341BF948